MFISNLFTPAAVMLLLPVATFALPFAPTNRTTPYNCNSSDPNPAPFEQKYLNFSRPIGDIDTQAVLAAAPELAEGCEKAPFGAAECSTPETVVTHLNEAFAKYNITSLGHKIAILANEAFESVGFTANTNQGTPKPPGQGTKSMLGFHYVVRYVASFPEHLPLLQTPTPIEATNITWENYNQLVPAERQKTILGAVLPDKYTFGSGPWFLTTQCDPYVQTSVMSGGAAGFERFLGKCVYSTTDLKGRLARWCNAAMALAPKDMRQNMQDYVNCVCPELRYPVNW